jgi:hypothetical protein
LLDAVGVQDDWGIVDGDEETVVKQPIAFAVLHLHFLLAHLTAALELGSILALHPQAVSCLSFQWQAIQAVTSKVKVQLLLELEFPKAMVAAVAEEKVKLT